MPPAREEKPVDLAQCLIKMMTDELGSSVSHDSSGPGRSRLVETLKLLRPPSSLRTTATPRSTL